MHGENRCKFSHAQALKRGAAKMVVFMKILLLSSIVGLLSLGSACSSSPSSESKKAAAPIEPVTGQTALYRMYQVARSWAPDLEVLQLTSLHPEGVPEAPGKAGAWQATFVSESKNAARNYTYSVVDIEPTLHQGVFASQPENWSASGDTKPFLIAAVKTDTDAAYKKAVKTAGAAAKQEKVPTISFLLQKLNKFTNPTWRVIWGESLGTADLSAYVDASTGEYLETMH